MSAPTNLGIPVNNFTSPWYKQVDQECLYSGLLFFRHAYRYGLLDTGERRFTPQAPNQLLCGDITYSQTDEGWLYLAAVIDMFSRQVVGWSLQSHMQTSLVKNTLAMAWWRRRPEPGAIFHSNKEEAILQLWLPSCASQMGHAPVYEPQRQLLG